MAYRKRPATTAGREKGVPNLQKKIVDGKLGVVNQHGVFFAANEKEALEKAVRKANRRSKAMHEAFDALPFRMEGKEQAWTVGERIKTLGKEADFSISKKSMSLQRFESKEEYERYMANLDRVNSGNYIADRAKLYLDNYEKALTDPHKGLGFSYNDVSDIIEHLRSLKPKDYLRAVATNEELEIGYPYDEEATAATLNRIRSALGLPHRDLDTFWNGDEY